jgi:hypothetical protein
MGLMFISPNMFSQTSYKPGADDVPFRIDIKRNFGNIKTVNLSSMGQELQYIFLETSPAIMLERIRDLAFSDKYIFVSDINKLLQFDKNGKFIRQIGSQGRGPGEYRTVSSFCIDDKRDEIYIISGRDIVVFDFNGKSTRSFKISHSSPQIILKDQDKIMYHLFNLSGPDLGTTFSWIITDRQGTTYEYMRNNLKRLSQPGLNLPRSPLYQYNSTAHFMEFGIDTLYYFQGAQKKPYAIFSLGDLKMDTDPLTDSREALNKIAGKLYIDTMNENDTYLFIKIHRWNMDDINATFNKKTKEFTILSDNGFKNDIDGGMTFYPKYIYNDNILVDYIDGFKLWGIINKTLSDKTKNIDKNKVTQLENLKNKLAETSNPVLMLVK